MTTFKTNLLPALDHYKSILRKTLPADEAKQKINDLKLRRKQLQNAPETTIYETALNILKELSSWDSTYEKCQQYIQQLINEYIIEDNKLVQPKQKAANALLDVIQIIRFRSESQTIITKLDTSIKTINKYGSSEQCAELRAILQKIQYCHHK